MSTIIEKSFSGDLESLELLRKFISEVAEDAKIEKKAAYKLVLAVDEVASNIILHGYEENGLAGSINVICDIEPERLSIRLEDTSPEFNPLQVAPPDSLEDAVEDRPIGGLGIYLAVNGIDKFDYEFKDGKNCNIFVVKRDSE